MLRKRLLAAILLAFFLCGCLAGCGPTEPNRTAPTITQRQTVAIPTVIPTAAPTTESVSATPSTEPTTEPETLPMTASATEPVTVPETAAPSVTEEPATEPTLPPETVSVSEPEKTEALNRGVPNSSAGETEAAEETEPTVNYIANTNTKKFHYPSCSSVSDMKEENMWYFTGTRDELIEQGYVPCKRCKP